MRSIVASLRELVSNQRRATRHEARLKVNVSSLSAESSAIYMGSLPILEGHTRDISLTGLGLLVPSIHVGGRYLAGENRTLRISLNLPSSPIEIDASPVRYERVTNEEESSDSCFLIGAHITRMNEADRARFVEYVSTLR